MLARLECSLCPQRRAEWFTDGCCCHCTLIAAIRRRNLFAGHTSSWNQLPFSAFLFMSLHHFIWSLQQLWINSARLTELILSHHSTLWRAQDNGGHEGILFFSWASVMKELKLILSLKAWLKNNHASFSDLILTIQPVRFTLYFIFICFTCTVRYNNIEIGQFRSNLNKRKSFCSHATFQCYFMIWPLGGSITIHNEILWLARTIEVFTRLLSLY